MTKEEEILFHKWIRKEQQHPNSMIRSHFKLQYHKYRYCWDECCKAINKNIEEEYERSRGYIKH